LSPLLWKSDKVCALLGEGESLPFPLSVHLQVTTRCNLNCAGCWYRESPADLLPDFALSLAEEMAQVGSAWLAIGGGEPMLWGALEELTERAHGLGLKVAITTNGTLLRPAAPDRLHVSFDAMHGLPAEAAMRALRYYRDRGAVVGVNHIVTTAGDLQRLEKLIPEVSTITLLLPKPPRPEELPYEALVRFIEAHRQRVWLDPCLGRVLQARGLLRRGGCRQGITSMYIDVHGRAARCSNVRQRLPYRGLLATWRELACPPDKWQPEPCILRGLLK